MFNRQKVLLAILLEAPRPPTRVQLMKWAFLLREETCLSSDRSFYDFVPYKYGPFSFALYRDLKELARLGYLNAEDNPVSVHSMRNAKNAVATLPQRFRKAVKQMMQSYGHLALTKLIDYVYAKYSWFASRSELRKDALEKSEAPCETAIYTVGYEGVSIDLFLQKLLRKEIRRLIDVRSNPLSRKYGFSKRALQRHCENVNIEYVHLPDLGIPSSLRRSLKTRRDYRELMRRYKTTILPTVRHVCAEAARLIQESPSALVCFEADVTCCHRAPLANSISSDTGLAVVHL